MLLFCCTSNNTCRFPLWSPASLTQALTNFLTTNVTSVVIWVATAPVYVDCPTIDPMLFTGILLTSLIRPTTAPTGAGAGATAPAAAGTTITPTQAATTAAQVHAAQQAAQAAILATTLPATFNLNTLPTDVKTRHLHYLDPSYLLTASDMVPFPTATGGACPSFSTWIHRWSLVSPTNRIQTVLLLGMVNFSIGQSRQF